MKVGEKEARIGRNFVRRLMEPGMKTKTYLTLAALACAALLTGCMSSGTLNALFTDAYGARADGGYEIPAVPISEIPVRYRRQEVDYSTNEKPGTIIVDTKNKFLYYIEGDDKAIRYGIGVGREGFSWKGKTHIAMKREWPHWTPPAAMIRRQPELAKYRHGMDPGLRNPLGARALYLFTRNGDTGYRLHGSPEWRSIGHAVSSGCIRLMNQDIIDLYNRAKVGDKVIVM
jgi:lipoprotein-anchoring transpeptidase ErfK/SrfK